MKNRRYIIDANSGKKVLLDFEGNRIDLDYRWNKPRIIGNHIWCFNCERAHYRSGYWCEDCQQENLLTISELIVHPKLKSWIDPNAGWKGLNRALNAIGSKHCPD